MQIKTKDSQYATFLWTLGDFQMKGIEKVQGYRKKIVYFVFETKLSQEEIDKLLNDYKNGKTLVEPKQYSWKRAEIKEIIKENIFS